jgi:hypothetical protein
MSFLSVLGGDIKKVFGWLGSSKGQATISAVETGVEAVWPAADGAINLLNTWGTEIFKSEAIAQAAAATPGATTNLQKASLVLQAMTPQAILFAQQNKLPTPTAATLQTVNNSIVAILNALTGVNTAASTAPPVPPTPAVAVQPAPLA